jgi:predicted GIY-YIG superfamily endonuclease
MFYVYRLESTIDLKRNYVGFSSNLKQRLTDHNRGHCDATRPFRPWRIKSYAALETEQQARDFDRYLKTVSGNTFGNKRLWHAPTT